MPKTQKTWIWVVLSLALVFTLGYLMGGKWKCNSSPITTIDTVFFPQPTFEIRDSFIHDTITKYIPVNANPQTDYIKPIGVDTTIRIVVRDSLIYLEDPNSKILKTYSPNFLRAYPDNPKLIRNKIAKNLISYDFLLSTGYARTMTYPIDLENYTYVWETNSFKAIPLPKVRQRPKIKFESYTYLTYNPFRNSSRLAIDGTINIGNFGITIFGAATTNTKPNFDFGIGPKIRIK